MNIKSQKITAVFVLLFSLNLNFVEAQTFHSSQQISFKENLGQVHDQNQKARPDILFSGSTNNMSFHLSKAGISYQLRRVDSWQEIEDHQTKLKIKVSDQNTFYRIDAHWLNANPDPVIKKGSTYEGFENFYQPSCPKGAEQVRSYSDITYMQLYRGIDLKWYEKKGNLKYDYLISAGADYKLIRYQIKGATRIYLNKTGELCMETPLGTLTEQAPLVLQNGKKLPSKWKVNENEISFEIESVNPLLPYIIDPSVRVWGTFFGTENIAYSNCVNSGGDVFMTGLQMDNGLNLATTGVHQVAYRGNSDAYLVKFNTAGARIWCTYYGGSDSDRGNSCSSDTSGNIYLLGTTESFTDAVMATAGAHQVVFGSPNRTPTNGIYPDAFLVKFNSSGLRQWGTYYGGSGEDSGGFCVTDQSGNTYIAGTTDSQNGTTIATPGSHQQNYANTGGQNQNGFLTKFNSQGVRQWGTYYGGNGMNYINSCAVDNAGNIYACGKTNTTAGSTVIATPGTYQPAASSGSDPWDAFLVKFDASGVRQWGTYFGQGDYDDALACCADKNGAIYMSGITKSHSGIATAGALQTVLATYSGAYLAKFNANNGLRDWATYYSDGGATAGFCFADEAGGVFCGGSIAWGASITSPPGNVTTPGVNQELYGGGLLDGVIAKFTSAGKREWCTYYGGDSFEEIKSCAVDKLGNVFICGYTISTNDTAIATPGSFQTTQVTNGPASLSFLAKLKDTDTHIVGLEKPAPETFEICLYPNPAKEFISISTSDNKQVQFNSVEVINISGELIYETQITNKSSQNINIQNIPNGTYFLNLKQDGYLISTKKLVILK